MAPKICKKGIDQAGAIGKARFGWRCLNWVLKEDGKVLKGEGKKERVKARRRQA